jgi:predicted PurR-regulated permease PerM
MPMKLNSSTSSALWFLVGAASLGLVVTFLHSAAELINAFIISLIIVITVSPVMFGLKKRGAPTWLAFIGTILVLAAVLLIFALIVIGAGKQFLNALPEITAEAEQSVPTLQSTITAWGAGNVGLDPEAIAEFFNPAPIFDLTGKFISGLIDFASNAVLIVLLVVFMLVDVTVVPNKLGVYMRTELPIVMRLNRYTILVRRYIGITTIVGLVTGVLDTIMFSLVGIEFAVLWGIVAFLFSFIPTIGFWIACIPPVILAYVQFGFPTALLVFFGIVIINGFAENIVKPRFMGVGLNLSFFTVFFSVVVWSAILGPMGAILSIPLTVAIKVLILEGDEGGRWFFDLISDKKRNEPAEPSTGEIK